MGQNMVRAMASNPDFHIAFGVDRTPDKFANGFPVLPKVEFSCPPVDLIIDFSHPDNLSDLLAFAVSTGAAALIATTGLSDENHALISESGLQIPVLTAANTSLGINTVVAVLRELRSRLGSSFDVEIIEKHHRHKLDAPSGTACLFAQVITKTADADLKQVYGREGRCGPREQAEIGVHAVRGGGICGDHTVIFAGEHEVIEIRHSALSRELFAYDALRLGRKLVLRPPGIYSTEDLWHSKTEEA